MKPYVSNLTSHLFHRTKHCIAANWESEASTCSDVHVWPCQCDGARRSPGATGNHVSHRWQCTGSTARRASEGHSPLWSNSLESLAWKIQTHTQDTTLWWLWNMRKHCIFSNTSTIKIIKRRAHSLSHCIMSVHLWSPLHILWETLVPFVFWQ